MAGRVHRIVAGPASVVAVCLLASATSAAAQNRFEALTENVIAGVSDLRIIIVRDNLLSACYTLFVMESRVESPPPLEVVVIVPSPDVLAERERQSNERTYEQDHRTLEENYERPLRKEMPESYPWASDTPGMRSGGWEDSANATRRATVDSSPTSAINMKTLSDQLARLDDLTKRLIEAPRLAVSGPAKCSPGSSETTKPLP